MKNRLTLTLSTLISFALLAGCGGAQLPSAATQNPSVAKAQSTAPATLSGRIYLDAQATGQTNQQTEAASAQAMPETLKGIRARIDGRDVAIRITGYWPPKSADSQAETMLDYAIDAAIASPGNQVLEVFDSQGRQLGATIIQIEAGRARVHDISPWSTAMLELARHQATQDGATVQNLRPAELLSLSLAPELKNPRAYLESLAQVVDGDDDDASTQSLGGESARKWL